MNQNYVHTITLYNRIKAADTQNKKERWIKTVLQNCFWKSQVNTGFNGTQVSSQNAYVVRIPQDNRYLPYADFIKHPEGHFTVAQDDIVIHGVCTEEITGGSGQTVAQILTRHKPDAFKVTAFSDNTAFPVARHYRLGG